MTSTKLPPTAGENVWNLAETITRVHFQLELPPLVYNFFLEKVCLLFKIEAIDYWCTELHNDDSLGTHNLVNPTGPASSIPPFLGTLPSCYLAFHPSHRLLATVVFGHLGNNAGQ